MFSFTIHILRFLRSARDEYNDLRFVFTPNYKVFLPILSPFLIFPLKSLYMYGKDPTDHCESYFRLATNQNNTSKTAKKPFFLLSLTKKKYRLKSLKKPYICRNKTQTSVDQSMVLPNYGRTSSLG